jgi:hypothetical protein
VVTLGTLHELVEEIAEPTAEMLDVESPLGARRFAVQMEGNFSLYAMLPRDDIVLSGLDRLSAARTDKRRSVLHLISILPDERVRPDPWWSVLKRAALTSLPCGFHRATASSEPSPWRAMP